MGALSIWAVGFRPASTPRFIAVNGNVMNPDIRRIPVVTASNR
jgi:hypothetical protein